MRPSTLTKGDVAVLSGGSAECPRCGKRLCDVSKDASATGVTLWCRMCRAPVALKFGRATFS